MHSFKELRNIARVFVGAVGISGGEWNASWELTKSSKVVYLLRRLQEIDAAPPPPAAAATGGAFSSCSTAVSHLNL